MFGQTHLTKKRAWTWKAQVPYAVRLRTTPTEAKLVHLTPKATVLSTAFTLCL